MYDEDFDVEPEELNYWVDIFGGTQEAAFKS